MLRIISPCRSDDTYRRSGGAPSPPPAPGRFPPMDLLSAISVRPVALGSLRGVAAGPEPVGDPDREGGTGAGIAVPCPERGGVADRVEPGHLAPVDAGDYSVDRGDRTALRTDHPGVDPGRVERRPFDRSHAAVPREARIAVVG